jgi:hypothetical protein
LSRTHSVPPLAVPLGCRESEDVMTGSSAVSCRVAIEQTLGRPLTVAISEGVPVTSVGQAEAMIEGTKTEDIVMQYNKLK